jgi:hypothetical protein
MFIYTCQLGIVKKYDCGSQGGIMRRAPAQSYSTAERALTERALKLHGVQDDLQDLVNVGCNRLELLATLDLAFLADETWDALVGMDCVSSKPF